MTHLDTKRALMEEFEEKFPGHAFQQYNKGAFAVWLSHALDTVRRETEEEHERKCNSGRTMFMEGYKAALNEAIGAVSNQIDKVYYTSQGHTSAQTLFYNEGWINCRTTTLANLERLRDNEEKK